MIVSKPKSTALISLGIFIIISFASGSYALSAILNKGGFWYHYLIAILFLSIAIVLLLRQLFTYKTISIGAKKIKVNYPFRGSMKELVINDIIWWNETIIKTKNAPFKQLEIKFDKFLLKLSIQENTHYDQIKKYLKKRARGKEANN